MHYYVHIPFCHRVCPYCKFAVSPVVNELTKKRYLEYLKKEINNYFNSWRVKNGETEGNKLFESEWKQENRWALACEFLSPSAPFVTFQWWKVREMRTLYFGWWTPSILSIEELQNITSCFPFFQDSHIPTFQHSNYEFTLEANPENITEEKAREWKNLWINRVSLWVQSLDDIVLDTIKRASQEITRKALNILNQYFENINIDLILWLPYSQPGDTLQAIQELHKKYENITHTSVYILEDERYPKEWNHHYPTEEDIQREYSLICDYLEQLWWRHYEISNWAKPWYESIHNQSYWNHSDYRGFGLSAGSHIQWRRFSNSSSFRGYFLPEQEGEILTKEQLHIEKIMFGLRTFSLDEWLIMNKQKIKQFLEEWLLQKKEIILSPTKTWIFMLDYIISELV